MKIWKMKYVHYSDVLNELNNLEKQKAVIRQITRANNEQWFTIFYTVEDEVEEE